MRDDAALHEKLRALAASPDSTPCEKADAMIASLEADRDDDSCRSNAFLTVVLIAAEAAADATGQFTRARRSGGFLETASLSFDESGWSIRLNVRNTGARGRGARGFYGATGNGETPRAALESFLERLPFFVQATS